MNNPQSTHSQYPESLFDTQPTANDLFAKASQIKDSNPNQKELHDFLEIGHLSIVNKTISEANKIEEWFEIIHELILESKLTVGHLINQRARYYGDKTCFQEIEGNQIRKFTYQEIWDQIIQIGQALCAIESISDNNITIGIFTENSIRGALLDLACLSFHITIVPIPVTTTPDHLAFIIDNSTITQLFIGGSSVQIILRESKVEQKSLDIYHLEDPAEAIIFAKPWESFISQAVDSDDINVLKRINQCSMHDLATVMYTSGTTDEPKGIVFTQENIVTKRFARALALPDFSCDDIFLCFLPLYHTFGRYFELLGSIFWGATYTFAESPYFKSLLKDFCLIKPSIFISVPKRWIQLMEHTDSIKPVNDGKDQEIKNIVNKITGENLKYGLSAAGYLDPDVFRFFQSNGINLLSGYGMTEATGGITMTPIDEYQPDSVGVPLPGIQLTLADDGELLINGPYVSSSYFGKNNGSTLVDGWFHTGDIFNENNDHYYIIDRKKEIYKNSRGQTISPQKIENMFQDFDGIKSAFLVGDGLEFNTLLIYSEPDSLPMDISNASLITIREYYSSLVQSVNSFLAPFERVINFAIIKRDFNSDDELTQKGTYKRKQILKNFREIINPMYEKNHITLSCKNYQIHIPNWLLREKGVSRNDVKWNGSKISIKNNKISLKLSWENSKLVIGDFIYHTLEDSLDLQELLLSPELWLGNSTFAKFIGKNAFQLTKFEPINDLQLEFPTIIDHTDKEREDIVDSVSLPDLVDLHKATRQLYAGHLNGFIPFNYLLASNHGDLTRIAFNILLSFRNFTDPSFRMKAIEAMLPELSGELFFELLSETHQQYYEEKSKNGFTVNVELLKDNQFEAILSKLGQFRKDIKNITKEQFSFIQILLPIVANYGIHHPTKYIWARSELYWWQISDCPKRIISYAQKAQYNLVNGFRSWIGPNQKLAINRKNSTEYTWNDVIVFDELVKPELREMLVSALINTAVIRESIFLFYDHRLIELDDIQPDGVWVTFLGKNHGKSVLRILVQTKDDEAYNFAININEEHEKRFMEEEIKWLVIMGSSIHGQKFVEEFGGYWPEYNLYTEEYIPGETLHQYLERNRSEIEENLAPDRWQMRWLHFIWSGAAAYINFWWRSDKKVRIGDPSPKNLIIPEHDYASGTRLISISNRKNTTGIANLLFSIYGEFIEDTENHYPGLKRMADWELIFSVILQVAKVEYGKPIIAQFREELNKDKTKHRKAKEFGLTIDRIDDFVDEVNNDGVLTKRMVFAALRYERWLDLNQNATLQARTTILQELYQDYNLGDLLLEYPETRVRFFLMTCLKDSRQELKDLLWELLRDLRARKVTEDDLQNRLHHIHENLKVNDEEQHFLTHLVFKHLAAADFIELVTMDEGERGRIDLVMLCEDNEGNGYRIRPPFHPKEIARFHSLLIKSNLEPVFQGNHEFLLIFDMKDRLVGGVYWKESEKTNIVHFEWIVIRSKYRNKHLSNQLMDELMSRLRNKGVQYVIVGFFQEEFFYKHGFIIDKNFGGLVKDIQLGVQATSPV